MKHESLPLVSTPLSEVEPKALCGGVMIRLDLGYFLRFGASLARVRDLPTEVTVGNARQALFTVNGWLSGFANEQTFGSSAFRTARHSLSPLLVRIGALLSRGDTEVIPFNEQLSLLTELNTFENALLAEASMADAYYVLEKEPYSTLALITKGASLFPPNTLVKVPEAERDLNEVGKCIAFELPTAAAFHIHRATEAVLRRYWTAVSGNLPKPKLRTIGVYLAAMKKNKCGDGKVIAALSQMNELHRNPTIHPEDMLSLDEAIALLGIANSVVAAMLKEIPDVQPEQPQLPGMGALAQIFGPKPVEEVAK